MKKLIMSLIVVTIIGGASFGVYQNSTFKPFLNEGGLASIEALAAETKCTRASISSQNTGTCKKKVNGTGDSCVVPNTWDSKNCDGDVVVVDE